jgi:hypothetical protein
MTLRELILQIRRKQMNQENGQIPVYREVQKFEQFWIWLIVLGIAALMWYAAVQQLLMHRPFGDRPMPDIMMIIFWLVFGIGLPTLFIYARLITEVRIDGIYLRFIPFQGKFQKIAFEELKGFEAREYRPIMEYGGWGIRFGSKGKAYIVSGNRGVQLEFTNGKRLLIGSQRADEFRQAIETASGGR